MLPRLHRLDRPLSMQAVGQGIIDSIDLRIVDDAVIIGVNTYIGSKRVDLSSTSRIPAPDSSQPSVCRCYDSWRNRFHADVGGTENSPTNRGGRRDFTGLHTCFYPFISLR